MNDADLQTPQLYINRELSFLEFNQRVLEQAKDGRIPLLERVKFLCISCANLDEFFEIRVAGLKELLEAGALQIGPDGLSVSEQLKAIRGRAARLIDEQYQVLNDVLMPDLAKNGVVFVSPESWTEAQSTWLEEYFHREVEPVLSPLALDPARLEPQGLLDGRRRRQDPGPPGLGPREEIRRGQAEVKAHHGWLEFADHGQRLGAERRARGPDGGRALAL